MASQHKGTTATSVVNPIVLEIGIKSGVGQLAVHSYTNALQTLPPLFLQPSQTSSLLNHLAISTIKGQSNRQFSTT